MGFRTIFIKNGERLKLKLDNLIVVKEGEEISIPLVDIESIILEGDQTTITSRLLAKFTKYHIALIICDSKFHPTGIYLGLGQYHRSAKRNSWQSNWTELQKQNIWTEIVTNKIDNQIEVARNLNVSEERILVMNALKSNILLGDESNREGHVAKVYFNSLFGMGFSREDNSFPNLCLNYGYSIIRALTARSVVSLGLIPSLGVFHKNEYNSFNLVDDLMEPFRPLMDWYVYTNLMTSKEEYLTYDLRIKLIEFLNCSIVVNNKKIFINQAVNDYVNSFIRAMESNDYNVLKKISFESFKEVN